MSCNHCKATVEQAITALDPAAVLQFDMAARTVAVTSAAALEAMKTALKAAGYEATAA